jgi:hypothetical protein
MERVMNQRASLMHKHATLIRSLCSSSVHERRCVPVHYRRECVMPLPRCTLEV